METSTFVYIAISFITVFVISLIFKKKWNKYISYTSSLETENEHLRLKLSESSSKFEKDKKEITEKYETLLKDAKSKCEQLNKIIKDLTEKKNDNFENEYNNESNNVDKLKKKIKDLEKEIEENEDDLNDLRKRLRFKENDLSNLQDNLRNKENISKELQKELDHIKKSLEDKIVELGLKIDTLNFLQEILSAKEISNTDVIQLNKNIDTFVSFVKNDFIESYTGIHENNEEEKAYFKEKKKYYSDTVDEWSAKKRKNWLDGKTTIAFIGEFSAGKTSIVNRIISQDNHNTPQLPVSTKVTTAIPTYITGGTSTSYSFITSDGKRKSISENTFKNISKDILDQIKGVSSLIKYFVMTYENYYLDGISILDTPGFNSNNNDDHDRTFDVINECDALFWVFDINSGNINKSSISVLKEKLNKPLYVVINKVDTKSQLEVENVENIIRKTLLDEGLHVKQFIKFSTQTPLENIMIPIMNVERIGTDTFVQKIRELINIDLKAASDVVIKIGQDYNKTNKYVEDTLNKIKYYIDSVQNNCEEACEIPQWTNHFFGKNRYEMSQFEGNRLINLLDNTSNISKDLSEKIYDLISGLNKLRDLKNDLYESKDFWRHLNNLNDLFNKISKNI